MEYKTLTRSRRIKGFKREVRRIYKKTIKNSGEVRKEKLLFRVGG